MPTYTFHHFGQAAIPSGLSFVDLDDELAALAYGRDLLTREQLRRVEVYDDDREVGVVVREAAAA